MTNHHDPDADARIDAMARSAGGALRRPAPADGIARAQRGKRNQQMTRLALAGTAVLALGVVGVAAFGGDEPNRVGPTDTVSSTVPDTTPASATPDSTVPPTSAAPNPGGAPEVVYGSPTSVAGVLDAVQTLFDPTTGAVIGTAPVDFEESRQAQDERYGQGSLPAQFPDDPTRPGAIVARYTVGEVTYTTESLPSEISSLEFQDQAALPRYDRCGQAELLVEGATDSALPERITAMSIGADGRYLIVLSAECPEAGTLLDGYTAQPYDLTMQVFDAADPSAGRTLLTERAADCICDLNGFSFDSRFFALRSFNDGPLFRVFDLDLGSEVIVDEQGCDQYFTTFADTFGPWVGDSSIAAQLDCGESRYLLIRDVAPGGGDLRIELITEDPPTVEVDVEHFDEPSNAWFTVCSFGTSTCWVGHGEDPLVELTGMQEASFMPLGFRYGG